MKTSTTLVTGAFGFIGQHLCSNLEENGFPVRRMTRASVTQSQDIYGDLSDIGSLHKACEGVDTIFHCAGYAHAFGALSENDAQKHWMINFEGTRNLLQAAKAAGVKRFVLFSSVKAMPDPGNLLVDENFVGEPSTPYGRAKKAAEQAVLEMGLNCGMHVVILRLCMVYGPGSRGNLERMAQMVKRGLFPPLPETRNHRSMIHVNDVISAARIVAEDERANGQIYILAGNEAPSGHELFNLIRSSYLMSEAGWHIPLWLLQLLAKFGTVVEKLLGKRLPFNQEVLDRLIGSAWYSANKIKDNLHWQPRMTLEAGIKQLVSSR